MNGFFPAKNSKIFLVKKFCTADSLESSGDLEVRTKNSLVKISTDSRIENILLGKRPS